MAPGGKPSLTLQRGRYVSIQIDCYVLFLLINKTAEYASGISNKHIDWRLGPHFWLLADLTFSVFHVIDLVIILISEGEQVGIIWTKRPETFLSSRISSDF